MSKFTDIRNYLYLDLHMEPSEADVIAHTICEESDLTMEDPWDILSRELQKEEEGDPCMLSF